MFWCAGASSAAQTVLRQPISDFTSSRVPDSTLKAWQALAAEAAYQSATARQLAGTLLARRLLVSYCKHCAQVQVQARDSDLPCLLCIVRHMQLQYPCMELQLPAQWSAVSDSILRACLLACLLVSHHTGSPDTQAYINRKRMSAEAVDIDPAPGVSSTLTFGPVPGTAQTPSSSAPSTDSSAAEAIPPLPATASFPGSLSFSPTPAGLQSKSFCDSSATGWQPGGWSP